MSDSMALIGVDCACQVADIGLARAELQGRGPPRVTDTLCGKDLASVAEQIAGWAKEGKVLIAFDAPLGWPAAMALELQDHFAGDRLSAPPNAFFRRETDRDSEAACRLPESPEGRLDLDSECWLNPTSDTCASAGTIAAC